MQILRVAFLGLTTAALMSCSVGEQVARDQARDVVDGVVAEKFPGVPAKPITDCVIDNASLQEILALAAAAGTGNTGKAAEVVGEIIVRPETVQCIAVKGLPAVLQGVL